MFEGLNDLKKAKKEYDDLVKAKGEKIVRAAIKEFFEIHPEIVALRWKQYTPYFNDGDACVFRYCGCEAKLATFESAAPPTAYACPTHESVVTASPAKCGKPLCGRLTEALEPDEDSDDGWVEEYNSSFSASLKKDLKAFDDSMNECEDALLIAFGDHAQITATSKGIDVDSYEHD